jgi:hypothetical protein
VTPVRLVVANGCSMTYGDELADRMNTCWGALIARRLGADFVNLGACAGSNRRTVRLSVERLGRYTAERGLRPDEVLHLAMWTRMNRYEVHADEADPYPGLPETFTDGGWCRIHPQYVKRKDHRSTSWYRHLQNDAGDRSDFLLGWVLLDAWLARGGYRYGFLWAFDPDPDLFAAFPQYAAQLDLSRVIGTDRTPFGGPSFYSFGAARDDLGPDRHPLEGSHEAFVDEVAYDWAHRLATEDLETRVRT